MFLRLMHFYSDAKWFRVTIILRHKTLIQRHRRAGFLVLLVSVCFQVFYCACGLDWREFKISRKFYLYPQIRCSLRMNGSTKTTHCASFVIELPRVGSSYLTDLAP